MNYLADNTVCNSTHSCTNTSSVTFIGLTHWQSTARVLRCSEMSTDLFRIKDRYDTLLGHCIETLEEQFHIAASIKTCFFALLIGQGEGWWLRDSERRE